MPIPLGKLNADVLHDEDGNPIASVLDGATRRLAVDANISADDPNKDAFATGQDTIASAGTGEQGAAQAIPDGFAIVIRALASNTGNLQVGNSQANAQNAAVAFILAAGDAVTLRVSNLNLLWFDVTVDGEGYNWIVETA